MVSLIEVVVGTVLYTIYEMLLISSLFRFSVF